MASFEYLDDGIECLQHHHAAHHGREAGTLFPMRAAGDQINDFQLPSHHLMFSSYPMLTAAPRSGLLLLKGTAKDTAALLIIFVTVAGNRFFHFIVKCTV